MPCLSNETSETASVSYIETDIDCQLCLADVKEALAALRGVEGVNSNSGCLVVRHRTNTDLLLDIITRYGHRLVEADNGEVAMGSATALLGSCVHHRAPRIEQRHRPASY